VALIGLLAVAQVMESALLLDQEPLAKVAVAQLEPQAQLIQAQVVVVVTALAVTAALV
jgi:hypothetical protein